MQFGAGLTYGGEGVMFEELMEQVVAKWDATSVALHYDPAHQHDFPWLAEVPTFMTAADREAGRPLSENEWIRAVGVTAKDALQNILKDVLLPPSPNEGSAEHANG